MIRTSLLFLYVIGLAVYAPRNWYVSLCGALLLMAVVQHPDMPRNMAGIQGLNPWNILMLSVIVNWLIQRKGQGLVWDLPGRVIWLLILYGGVVVLAFLRMIFDQQNLGETTPFLISEHLINCIKWVIPGLILYDTCRTRKQIVTGLLVILGIYLLLAIQVVKWMPLSSAMEGAAMASRASKLILKEVGYNRVNMSMMLAGASWAFVAATLLFKERKIKVALLTCAAIVSLGQALTGGRAGYATWAVLGLIFGLVRWRRALLLAPAAALLVLTLLPGVSDRLFQGFGDRQGYVEAESNQYEVTSGRNLIWPYVIEEIKKAPIFGYGRLAMNRLALDRFLREELGEEFPHPHNAYLEMLLDNGFVGLILVLPFYVLVIWWSLRLFRDRFDRVSAAVGGATLVLVLALLIAAMGSQTFYPREGSVGMWAAIGLMLRVSVEKRKGLHSSTALFERVEPVRPTQHELPSRRRWHAVAARRTELGVAGGRPEVKVASRQWVTRRRSG